jgi:hypothetical protein
LYGIDIGNLPGRGPGVSLSANIAGGGAKNDFQHIKELVRTFLTYAFVKYAYAY